MRLLDGALLVVAATIALQLMPLPRQLPDAISPATPALQDVISLQPLGEWRPLSILPADTRGSLLVTLAAILLFWAARRAFERGGVRLVVRWVGVMGLALALVAIVQHTTAPRTIYWLWLPDNPRARPYGPFIDRNHLATWLVLAIPVSLGYLIARIRRSHADPASARLMLARLLAHGGALGTLLCIGLMTIALVATLSRSGFVGLMAAAALTAVLQRRGRRRALAAAAGAIALLVVVGLWLDSGGLAQRVEGTLNAAGPQSRPVIWAETVRIVRAFPVAGTGAGTFGEAMLQYQRTGTAVLFNHAHNEPLQLLATGGVLLTGAVLIALVLFIREARRRLAADHTTARPIRIGALAGLGGVAIQCVWEVGLHMPANLMLATVLAAIALQSPRGESEDRTAPAS